MQFTEASFLIDIPFLLPLFGYLAGYLPQKMCGGTDSRRRLGAVLFSLVILGFYFIAGGLYFDFLSFRFLLGEIGAGNHFMWNSGIEVLGLDSIFSFPRPTYRDFWSFPNLSAMGIFIFVYPSVAWIFYRAGRKSK